VGFEPVDRIWRTWAPPRCNFFHWLAALNRCWTADRLARRGSEHLDKYPLCDQEEETVQHLLVSCVFAREVWARLLSIVVMQHVSPNHDDEIFQEWWRVAEGRVPTVVKKGFNSLVALGVWRIWKHRNNCVFDGASPSVSRVLQEIRD
jgi:hypothetical protein